MTFNDSDFTTFRTYIIAAVKKVFDQLGGKGELAPVCFIVAKDGVAVMPVMEFMENDQTKDALLDALTKIAHQDPRVQGIAIVNEIWTATTSMAEDLDSDDFVRPEHRPNRGEAAMLRLEFRGFGPEIWVAPITKEAAARKLAEFTSLPAQGGRMAAPLFPEAAFPN